MSAPEKTAPAIGYSIVSNMGGDRQMTVQCFVGEDEADEVIGAKIDRIFRVVDRQKARYEIVDLRAELSKHRETLAQFEEDLANVEADFAKKQALADVQIEELSGTQKKIHDEAYEAHHASGRSGAFKPTGYVKGNLDRIKDGIAKIKTAKETAIAERDQHREGVLISITRFQKAIAELEAKIADREALLSGG